MFGGGGTRRRGYDRDLMRTLLHCVLCAAGLIVVPAVVAAGQASAPDVLSGALRTHVQEERFQVVTSIRGLPLGVRDALQKLFGTPSLDIAEPGDAFASTGAAANSPRPIRRLVAAGCSTDH